MLSGDSKMATMAKCCANISIAFVTAKDGGKYMVANDVLEKEEADGDLFIKDTPADKGRRVDDAKVCGKNQKIAIKDENASTREAAKECT